MNNEQQSRIVSSIFPPLILLAVAGLLILFASDYGATARRLPLLIAVSTVGLLILDLLSRLQGNIGALIRSALGAGFENPEMTHNPQWRAEVLQLLWVTACVSSMVLVGFLPTIPVFIFLYMMLHGKQTVMLSILISIVIVSVVGFVFEWLLDYDLYRGILFDQDSPLQRTRAK